MEVSDKPRIPKCCFCFKSTIVDSRSQQCIIGARRRMVTEVYNNCKKYINEVYLNEDEFLSWTQPKPLPFCKKCLHWTAKLTSLKKKLDKIQTQIEDLVISFTDEFIKLRLNEVNPTTCPDIDPMEYLKLQEIKIKQEQVEVDLELFENYHSEDSNGHTDTPEVETKPETTKKPNKRVRCKKENKTSRTKKALPKLINRKVAVNLTSNCAIFFIYSYRKLYSQTAHIPNRLKYDLDGNPIPGNECLPRRKAAMKAEETILSAIGDSLENETSSDSDTADCADLQESDGNSSGSEKKLYSSDRKLTEKNRKRTFIPSGDRERPYKCSKCDKTYTKKRYVLDHELTHDKNQRFKCDICENVSYAYARNLRQHLLKHKTNPDLFNNVTPKEETPVPRRFKCQHCDKGFKLKYHLSEHQRITHENKRFECTVCDASYAYIKNLRKHLLKAHTLHMTSKKKQIVVSREVPVKKTAKKIVNDKPRNVECTVCGKICDTPNQLYYHRSIVHAIAPRTCNICKDVFDNHELLKRHKKKYHLSKLTHKCTICDKEFQSPTGLKEHLERHKRGPDYKRAETYKCSLCAETFSSGSDLYFHMKTHGEVKPFECSMNCGKRFTTKSGMTKHVLIHTGEKSFLCEECGKGFLIKAKLNMHMRIHTGMLHYCEICGKGFQTTTHLKQHHRSHNKKDKNINTIENQTLPSLPNPNVIFNSTYSTLADLTQGFAGPNPPPLADLSLQAVNL